MGWQQDQDKLEAARAGDGGRTPAPWHWEIHDSSAATLCGGGLDAVVGPVMTVSPCKSCYEGKDDWLWGRCQTPSEADARLIAASPDMLAALRFAEKDPCFSKLGTVTQDEMRAAIARATALPSQTCTDTAEKKGT